jgi:hypothetical protein
VKALAMSSEQRRRMHWKETRLITTMWKHHKLPNKTRFFNEAIAFMNLQVVDLT